MGNGLNDKFVDLDENRLRASAEAQRDDLPNDLFQYFDTVEASLAKGLPPREFRERGLFDTVGKLGQRLGAKVLEQLHQLLCTADPEYDDLREHGRLLTNAAIAGVAAKVALAIGVSVGVASAATAFGILLIARSGIKVFCETFAESNAEG